MSHHILHNEMVFLLCEFVYVVSDLLTGKMIYHISHTGMAFLLCGFSYALSEL